MPQIKSTQSSLSDINMVPFIDVVLVLLIIFMITAPILQSGIEVDVPKTRNAAKELTTQHIVVTMDKNQLVYLGNDPVNIHQLGDKIKKLSKSQRDVIYLRADETVPFGAFCSVIDSLRQSGISNISIVTQPITERAQTR